MCLLPFSAIGLRAQTTSSAVFLGVQSTVPTTGLKAPAAVALDSNGNLYIADTGNNRVVKVTPAGVQTAVLSGVALVNAPSAVAVDTSGNLFVADTGNNRIVEAPAGGTPIVVGSGLASPSGVATDGAGNLYVADTGNNRIVIVAPSGVQTTAVSSSVKLGGVALSKPKGIFAASSTCQFYVADTGNNRVIGGCFPGNVAAMGSGLNKPSGGAYSWNNSSAFIIADTGNSRVLREFSTGASEVQVSIGVGLLAPGGVAADNSGNIYIADTGNNRIVKISSASVDFGSINLGGATAAQTLIFAFMASTTLNAKTPVQVLTEGAANLDFASTGSGTCAAGSYGAGSTCTVNVIFKPTLAGERAGAVVLQDACGNALATLYIRGVGNGPQIAYDPGVQSTLASGLSDPRGVAVDGAGNAYVADFGLGQVIERTAAGAQSVFANLDSPQSIALDGAGNLFAVARYGNDDIGMLEVRPGGTVQNVSNQGTPRAVAVDGSGRIYEADSFDNSVEILQTTDEQVISGGFTPDAVAVDGLGNLYIVDISESLVWKYKPVSQYSGDWSLVGSGYRWPQGVAVDQGGNVFVADMGNSQVVKVTPAGVQSTVGTGFSLPSAVAVDGAGNLYITDMGNGRLVKISRSTPPSLSFGSVALGKVSTAQQVGVENIGNASLVFRAPATGENASLSTGFTLGSATTCAEVSSSSGPATLPAGAGCSYFVSFAPTLKGTANGSLVMTDNNLNLARSTQTISLSGTAAPATAVVKLSGLSQTFTGAPVRAAASSNPAGLKMALTYNGKTTAPTAAGSYAVAATVAEVNYQGSATGTLVIAKATPAIAWASPAAIAYGTALTTKQLNATSKVPGKFAYSPALGTKPAKGTAKLSVTFTPTDAANLNASTTTVELTVK
jgi:sugar lactone lactonase YvrE